MRAIDSNKPLNIPVVIMAGGLGTRLYPYTKIIPKPLIPIGDISVTEHIINRFKKVGCNRFYLIVNYKKDIIKAYFNSIEKDYSLDFIDEETPLGTGGGLSLLKGKIDTTFVLTNCDIIIDADYTQIFDSHKKNQNAVTMVCSLKNITIPYGIVDVDSLGKVEKMREKPSMSFYTNTGMYFIEPQIIDSLTPENIGFPDIIERHRKNGELIGAYPLSERAFLDMGQPDKMEEMRQRIGNEKT